MCLFSGLVFCVIVFFFVDLYLWTFSSLYFLLETILFLPPRLVVLQDW